MKKLLALILAVLMVLSLVACGGNAETGGNAEGGNAEGGNAEGGNAEGGKVESNGKRIFMSAGYYTAPYGSPLMKAITEKAEALGYEINIVDGEGNADKQLTQIKTAVADGYDGIIYWPADAASTPPVVEYLNESNVPFIIVNTLPDDSVTDQCHIVASNEVQIGRELGYLMVKYYEENNYETMNVAYIEGDSGSSYTIHLTQGINEVIAEYPGIKIINEPQYSNFDPTLAMTIMEDLITKYGDEIDLVVTQDGGMFQGAYNAIMSAGKSYGIICQGQDLIVKDKLLSGELYASVAQDPFQEGSLAMINLDKLIKGEEVAAWEYTPTGPIYAADVDNYSWF